MKKITYPLLLLLLLSTPFSYAAPPYLGVSVGNNLSFNNAACVEIAKKVLGNDGFQKIVQYQNSATVFAAYRDQSQYKYKAVVKCLSDSGVIIVVAVANVPKHAKEKADYLQRQILQHASIKRSSSEGSGKMKPLMSDSIVESEEDNDEPNSETWQHTMLDRKECLERAESSIRDSGFYAEVDFDDDSVQGTNDNKYTGFIRCVTSESLVFFRITGSKASTRDQLLDKLQKNF